MQQVRIKQRDLMKNIIVCISVICVSAIVAAGVVSLSACSLLPKYSDPKSMGIDGEVYVTGFYDDLWPDGITIGEGEPAAFESKYYYWWKVENAPFDMYCAQNKEALYWKPAVYCKESQFDRVKQYYSDPENYDYYIGRYLEDDTSVLLDENDEEYAERAIDFMIKLDNALGAGGLFDPFRDAKVTLNAELFDWDRVTIYRVSKDGFFTTLHMELALYGGALYVYHSYDEQKSQTTFYRFEEDVSEHMASLFYKLNVL